MTTPVTILIVEDDFIVAQGLEKTLTGLGYQVVGKAATGQDAIAMAGTFHPSLILLDIKLGGPMDGIETARKIGDTSSTPIIYLTAYSDDQTFSRAIGTSIYGYLIKPVSPNALRTTIEIALEKYRIEESLRIANKKLNLLSSITRHDILNTLTALVGSVDLAAATTREPAFTAHLEQERQLIGRIQRQIEFTRDYESLGTGAPVWHDCTALITSVAAQTTPGPVKIVPPERNIWIFADPLFEKVIYNLIDNALRHGGKATEIRFFAEEDGTGLTLVCRDNGIGIPALEKDRIFERGYGKNTGLGLFLVREILAITGLTIREIGGAGEGARFEIRIPPGSYRIAPP